MFKKTQLSNGLRIITIPQKGTRAVTVLVLVRTGSKYETKEINGISHFLEHVFFKGTKKAPKYLTDCRNFRPGRRNLQCFYLKRIYRILGKSRFQTFGFSPRLGFRYPFELKI